MTGVTGSEGGGGGGGGGATAIAATQLFAKGLAKHMSSLYSCPPGEEDWSPYSASVTFKDPLEQHDGLESYKAAFARLKDSPFSSKPTYEVLDVSVAEEGKVRSRWTFSSEVKLLPWKPRVFFTGIATYELDPNGKVTKHVDEWDSVEGGGGLLGALRDILFGGCGLWREQPMAGVTLAKSKLLRRGSDYQIRRFEESYCAEAGFATIKGRSTKNDAVKVINDYFAGDNVERRAVFPTAPTLICVSDHEQKGPKWIASFLPEEYTVSSAAFPTPLDSSTLQINRRNECLFAVKRLNTQPDPLDGWVSTEKVYEAKTALEEAMLRDGVQAASDGQFRLARYAQVFGDGHVEYEVWIPIVSFQLRAAHLISAAEPNKKLPGMKLDFQTLDEDEEA